MAETNQLTPRQIEALDWIVREALEFASARDLAPKDSLSEAHDLLVAAQLCGNEELSSWALRLVDDAQKRADELDAASTKAPDVELPLMLVLSTAHITQRTAGLFEMKTGDIPIHHDKGEYGWIIPLQTGVPLPHTCPDELKGIFAFAEKLGATWVMLDRDADTVEGLPTWEW